MYLSFLKTDVPVTFFPGECLSADNLTKNNISLYRCLLLVFTFPAEKKQLNICILFWEKIYLLMYSGSFHMTSGIAEV